MQVLRRDDLISGLAFLVAGTTVAITSVSYRMGSPSEMGPGFFPFCLGLLLALIGAYVAVSAVSFHGGREADQVVIDFSLRDLTTVVASFGTFAVALEYLGLALAAPATVVVAMLLSRRSTALQIGITTAVLTAAALGIFVYGLNLQIRVWP